MPPLILADLGGVVVKIDPERCHRCWSQLSPLSLTEVAERVFPDELYEALERGQSTGREYLAHVRQVLRSDADDETLAACFNDIYLGIDDGVLDVLAVQQTTGARVVALTNTNPLHHDRWWPMYRDALGLFDHIYLSFELGARKPEVACFQAVLEAEGLPPDDVIFIDDVQGHVAAAQALGLVGLHYTSAEQLSKDLEQLDV